MKFGRNVLRVDKGVIFDLTSKFQDGVHNVLLRSKLKVLSCNVFCENETFAAQICSRSLSH